MKTNKIFLLISLSILVFMSCEDYSANDPQVISIDLVEQAPFSGAGVTASFLIEAEAEQIVIWWGDPDSDYDAYLAIQSNPSGTENTTEDHPKGSFFNSRTAWDGSTAISHNYAATGTYEVVVIATFTGDFGNDIKSALLRQTFTVARP